MTQTKKFFQKAVSNRLTLDQLMVPQIIRSTPANSKERLQNVEKALLESSSECAAIRSEMRAWRFNAVIAVGLVICGISSFCKPIRWRLVYISGTSPYSYIRPYSTILLGHIYPFLNLLNLCRQDTIMFRLIPLIIITYGHQNFFASLIFLLRFCLTDYPVGYRWAGLMSVLWWT